ncbi:uncharacterized protein [Miscanthus floridulus]|uniref:uncharacterized protein isoform X2 n=1 Tax=Miscanthus floridulus TaxID=154761 RepID=UPI003459E613
MQPVTATHVLRRPTPPAAASGTPPPPPPSPSNRTAPPLRPPELPLPSALVPPKKRRVLRTPPKATTPLPPPPPPVPVAVAVPAPTQPPLTHHAESPPPAAKNPRRRHPRKNPLHRRHHLRPPPSPPAEKPSPPPPPPPPPAEKPSSPPTPPLAGKPSSPLPPPPPAENPSLPPAPPPPPPSAVDEKPSAPPPTDAAAEPAPATKPRKITRKVRTIRKKVPKGTIAARKKAAAEAASAAAGASQPGKGHAPDDSSRNAAADEVVQKEQSFGGNTTEKPATTGNPIAVCETLLGKGTVGGGTLASGPAMDIGGEHEVEKKPGSRGEDRAEVVMSERQRRMTEVFVGGLSRDAKEEDVRAALSVAGEITEVRMIMDATTKKNKGYCFVRYRDSAQAWKAIAKFSNVKICGKQSRVAALDGNDKIFLGNLDKKWKKDDIMKLLLKIGVENIDVVTLLPDSNNPGYNRGFAFLELETYKDAQIAYKKLSRKDVFGKGLNIRVAWAEPLNGPNEKQMQKVNIRVTLAKSVQKGKKNMEDHKFCISEKDKTKTAKSERILGPSSLHILRSSSRVVPITGDKKSSTDHGLVQVLWELAPWRHEHTGSGRLTRNYPRTLSGEKRPFSALGIDSYCMSRNPHEGHERNTYATSTSSYSASPPAITGYSPPYHHESRRYRLDSDSDSVLSEEPWGGIQMRQACSRKSGMSHDSWH